MKTEFIDNLPLPYLARLLKQDVLEFPWSPEDGKAALLQQLNTPIWHDLESYPEMRSSEIDTILNADAVPATFVEELTAQSPRVELLHVIKAFAKRTRDDKDNPLCGVPGTLLYYAAIASALCAGQKISHLSDTELHRGIVWALAIEEAAPLRKVFAVALSALDTGKGNSSGLELTQQATSRIDRLYVVKRPVSIEILYYCPICEASNEVRNPNNLRAERCHECGSVLDASLAEMELIRSTETDNVAES